MKMHKNRIITVLFLIICCCFSVLNVNAVSNNAGKAKAEKVAKKTEKEKTVTVDDSSCEKNDIKKLIGLKIVPNTSAKTITISVNENREVDKTDTNGNTTKYKYETFTGKLRIIAIDNQVVDYIDEVDGEDNGTGEKKKITKWKHDDNAKQAFSNTFTKDGFYYKVDGKDAIIDKDHPLTLNIANYGANATISFGFVEDYKGCDDWKHYNEEITRNHDQYETWSTKTYWIENKRISIPSYDTNTTPFDNKYYNGICKAIRGDNSAGKIDASIFKNYDSSAEAQAYYREIINGSCGGSACENRGCDAKVTYQDSEAFLKIAIESAIKTWYIKKQNEKSNSSNENDTGTDSWRISFQSVCEKAVDAGHLYYADGGDNDTTKYQLYKLSGNFDKSLCGDNYWKNTQETPGKGEKVKSNQIGPLQCSAICESESSCENLRMRKDGKYNIEANVSNYYAVNVVEGKATYTYNYEGWESEGGKKENVNVCKRICEEALEVKYGPPIASTAGLCFEYQIQVTSRVRCQAQITAQPPTRPEVCTPVPWCDTDEGTTHQAGPNSDFESCIKSCDGGKYTKKCSDKCYKKVYNKKRGILRNSYIDNFDAVMEKMASYDGKYVRSGKGGTIGWSGSGYCRYYFENEKSITDARDAAGQTRAQGGFRKWVYSDGLCTDECWYDDNCPSESYLNKDKIESDYQANLKAYEAAIAKCDASATCTTKTANFKIHAKYLDESKKEQTLYFPYTSANSSSSKEQLKSGSGGNCSTKPNLDKGNHILLAAHGCYEGCSNPTEYHARWSFPGTWVNKKSGEITYEVPTDVDLWNKEDDKFCIPLNAQDVNKEWFNYYMSVFGKSNTISMNDTTIVTENKCMKEITTKKKTVKEENAAEGYNIQGETTSFGYFGWSIKVQCFYALNSLSTKTTVTKTTEDTKCDSNPYNYRVRPVDLENVFPSSGDGATSYSDVYGRVPGFNWSKYANNDKNSDFISYPEEYVKEIQGIKYGVYSDEYLDYEFHLTRDTMNKIRSDIKNNPLETKYNSYSSNSSDYVTQHGVTAYKSPLFRKSDGLLSGVSEGSKSSDVGVIPRDTVLGCNNIKNYSATGCKKGGTE